MITEKELQSKMDYMYQIYLVSLYAQRDQEKMLNNIITVIKCASQEQLLAFNPDAIVTCTLKLVFYYNETLFHNDNVCEWKRRKKRRLARECYHSLLQMYIPIKSMALLHAVLSTIYVDKLWEFETLCYEVLYNLLQFGISGLLLINTVWDKIELPNAEVEDTRRVIRIMYELLDVYDWPDTYETVAIIERILNSFYICITTTQSSNHAMPFPMFKKGLEVCIINIAKHVHNDYLLIIIQHMCSWIVEQGMTDETILEFGSTLEYTAYIHKVGLYEQTLTPKIFPLLMEMIASSSKIINLLGNRVIQYLLDRRENRINFDTPKIFFQNTQFDLKIGPCFKEDKLFCKLHREVLHDSLLKGITNHCSSRMNLEATYCTICLIAVEVPCGFTAAALVCFLMNLQDLTLKQNKYQVEISYHLHATVIAVMSLLCWIHKATVFYNYMNKIVMERAQWAPHLNPPIQSQYSFAAHHIQWNKPELFFVDWEARYGLWKCFRLSENDEDAQEL